MLYYPQLTSGSISQYPVSRKNRRRTVINALADGSELSTEDPGAAEVVWEMTYTHLTTAEIMTIEQLFEAVEGRLDTFTFLDPTDNLLSWSEDLSKSAWSSDPLIQIQGGVQDPIGLTGAANVTNTAQTAQQFGQSVPVASWFQYCFSVYLRADVPCDVQIIGSSQSNQSRRPFNVGPSWKRAIVPVLLPSREDSLYTALELPPGCRVSLFAPQLEPQPGAGSYKRTTDVTGVYPVTRFDDDDFTYRTTGPDQHSCSVRVKSCVAG
jgi:hypothetical protein